jgi:hypothetical protein
MRTLIIFFAGLIWFFISIKYRFLGFISFTILIFIFLYGINKNSFPPPIKNIFEKFIHGKIAYAGYFCLFMFSTCSAMIGDQGTNNQQNIASGNFSNQRPPNLGSAQSKVNSNVKLIEYKIFESDNEQKLGKYNWVQARIAPLNVGQYKSKQISETLKNAVKNLRNKFPNADLMTIWFYDREKDYNIGLPYTLGMIDWVPKGSNPGILEPEKYDYSNKDNFEYVISTCEKGEYKIPTQKAYQVYDFFFEKHLQDDSLTDEQLEKITNEKFKLSHKQFDNLFDEVSLFNICENNYGK